MEHASNFQTAPPRGVPSLAGPQTTLLERVTGRLTPDAAGQRTRSPYPRITEGRRVAVKADYRMWISPELWGGPSGPSRLSEVQGGRGHPAATTAPPPAPALGCGLPSVEEPCGKGSLFSTSTRIQWAEGKARCPISEGHTPTVTMGMTSIPPNLGPELCVTWDSDTYLPSLPQFSISGHLISNP